MPRAREHSRELTRAFAPVRVFLILIGQMPFAIKHKSDGTVSFKFSKLGFFTLVFALVYLLSTVNYFMVCTGIVTFFTRRPLHLEQTTTIEIISTAGPRNICDPNVLIPLTSKWEVYLTQKQLVTIAVVWSWMTVALVGSTSILFHGKYYVHYFNYWNKVVQVMNMDVTSGIKRYLIFENLSFLVVFAIFIALFLLEHKIKIIADTSAVMANFYFRTFRIEIAKNADKEGYMEKLDFLLYRGVGFVIMVYGYAGSRANIVQFLFFVRCLTNASKIWNDRLKKVLTTHELQLLTKEQRTAERLEHRLILKDHYAIVQLYKMTDNLFSRTLLTYYSLLIMTFVLELYQLATLRTVDAVIHPHKKCNSTNVTPPEASSTAYPPYFRDQRAADKDHADWQSALEVAGFVIVLLFQGVFFAVQTTRSAAKAYEEAMNGFQILRRRNYLNCNSKTERNFVHSLVFSYARNNPLTVTAGGYFAVNKTLLPALLGTVLNYVVAVYALQPTRQDTLQDFEDHPVEIESTTK